MGPAGDGPRRGRDESRLRLPASLGRPAAAAALRAAGAARLQRCAPPWCPSSLGPPPAGAIPLQPGLPPYVQREFYDYLWYARQRSSTHAIPEQNKAPL